MSKLAIAAPRLGRHGHRRPTLLRHLKSSAASGALLVLLAQPVLAQQVFHSADGTTTTDLEKAAKSWVDTEFKASWGLGAMNAQYAYAFGMDGTGVKVGVVDSGFYLQHPEFLNRNVLGLDVKGIASHDDFWLARYDYTHTPLVGGKPFDIPATQLEHIHGTHVLGIIGAAHDGKGMQGVAFNSSLIVTNSNGTDSLPYDQLADYNYFEAAYSELTKAGARIINTSWGQNPLTTGDLSTLKSHYFDEYAGQKTFLDAMADQAKQGVDMVVTAGNSGFANASLRASLPYFRPELEGHWLAVTWLDQATPSSNGLNGNVTLDDSSNRCGIAKYWCISAPGNWINSTAFDPSTFPDPKKVKATYEENSGTSMAAPEASGALALIMQRYPYMTNEQALDVLLTTARHLNVNARVADQNQNAPNEVYGWGIPDLKKAMYGPGQLLGVFDANLPRGTTDTWSNDISEDALKQRKQDDLKEMASWKADQQKDTILQNKKQLIDNASALLNALVTAIRAGDYKTALAAAQANPIAASVIQAIPNFEYWAYYIKPGGSDNNGYADRLLKAIPNEAGYQTIATQLVQDSQKNMQTGSIRLAYLQGKTDADYRGSLVKWGLGTLVLTGNNTFSGGVTLAGGELSVSKDANLGAASGTLTFDGGILQVTGTTFTSTPRTINWGTYGGGFDIADKANNFTVSQALTGQGGLAKLGDGTLTLTADNHYAGGTFIAAGTLQIGNGGTTGSITGKIENDAKLVFNRSDDIAFSGPISGSGSLTKSGQGTLTLTGDNIYVGGTLISSGTLQIGNGGTTGSIVGTIENDSKLVFDRSDDLAFAGSISGSGSLTKAGQGRLALTNASTYSGATTIEAGTLIVDGSIAASPTTVNSGATLAGNGAVGQTTIASGATLRPGDPIGTLTVNGSLAFQSGAMYVALLTPAAASKTIVTGNATLAGRLQPIFLPGNYYAVVPKTYTLLTSAGLNGTRFDAYDPSGMPTGLQGAVRYTRTDVDLDLTAALSRTAGLNANQRAVAVAVDNAFNSSSNGVSGGPATLLGLSGGALTNALTQASGQAAPSLQQTTVNAASQFVNVLSDVSIAGRAGAVGAPPMPAYAETDASAYAASGVAGTHAEREAYAAIPTKALRRIDAFVPAWSVWGSAYGGSATTSGNAAVGTSATTSRVWGIAVGADYRLAPDWQAGFAAAGGSTGFSVANGLGGGSADLFQAGGFLRHEIGAGYLTGALAYTWQDVTTDRIVTIAGPEKLRARFNANAFTGRGEAGYRFVTQWTGVTPYAAVQATVFDLPAYAEHALGGTNAFALRYAGKDATAARTELGARTDRSFVLNDGLLVLRGRAAWAHDYNANNELTATFQTLGTASFVVHGATPARDAALTTLSAEKIWANGLSLTGTFEGEFSNTTRSYAGKGIVHYTW